MEKKLTIIDEAGKEIEVEILFTFDWGITGKSYMVYTDNTTNEADETRVYASVYDSSGEDPTLYPVETDVEWDQIAVLLEQLRNEAQTGIDFDEMKLNIID